jgi:hypothetical protein
MCGSCRVTVGEDEIRLCRLAGLDGHGQFDEPMLRQKDSSGEEKSA